MKTEKLKTQQKINFPTWKQVLSKLLEEEIQKNPISTIPIANYLNQFSEKMELIKDDIKNKSASVSLQMMIRAFANYQADKSLPELISIQENFRGTKTEFHSIFNIEMNSFEWVSRNISEILGIEENDFTIENLIGIKSEPLIHHDDIGHFMRWAGISYLLFSIPGFTFESNSDYQMINFRIRTDKSKIESIKKLKHILISKKSQLYISPESTTNTGIPKYHFDTWSIMEPSYFESVKPLFVTNFEQSQFMNNLAFIINALILEIPVKYLIIINERGKHDRNKSVAHAINENIRKYSNLNFEFDEYKIGDYINKSIKPKITIISKQWCPELQGDITGDLEAVSFGKKLGLIGIPDSIERLIYSNLDIA
jgi:hypothetical protein